jgi:hypothetical protein
MVEIEKVAVEKQSDLLKKVKLMEAKQERGELIRTSVARLRGHMQSVDQVPQRDLYRDSLPREYIKRCSKASCLVI